MPIAIEPWQGTNLTTYAPIWLLVECLSEKLPLKNRNNHVFISRLSLARNLAANERLKHSPQEDWSYDEYSQGYWVLKGSATHVLALLLGIEPYDNWPEDGTYTRQGRIR